MALVLGIGLVLVLAILASVALVDTIETGTAHGAPSENLTQLLAAGVGGIVGALGAYLGRAGERRPRASELDEGPVVERTERGEPVGP